MTEEKKDIPGADAAERMMQLLPGLYRARDEALAKEGKHGPLRDLLTVIGETVEALEDDIAGLYDNLFVETCEAWALPYLGELVGYRSGDPVTARAGLPGRLRADVANALQQRRRRGTLASLEEICLVLTGWPSRAVEPYRLLAATEAMNHFPPMERALLGEIAPFLMPERGTICLRDGDAVDRLGTPFDDSTVRTVCLRPVAARPASVFYPQSAAEKTAHLRHRRVGGTHDPVEGNRYLRNGVDLFAFPLHQHKIDLSPAYASGDQPGLFLFDLRGFAAPLAIEPSPEPGPTHIADEVNLPASLRRRALYYDFNDFYGEKKSLHLWVSDDAGEKKPVAPEDIIVADLSGFPDEVRAPRPEQYKIAVDPQSGTILLGRDFPAGAAVWTRYRYPFAPDSLPIGGGGYERPLTETTNRKTFAVPTTDYPMLTDALKAWNDWRNVPAPGTAEIGRNDGRRQALIEIQDSGEYEGGLRIELGPEDDLEIRAAQGCRPVLKITDKLRLNEFLYIAGAPLSDAAPPTLTATTDDDRPEPLPTLRFDGLNILNGAVLVERRLGLLEIVHCTLLPQENSAYYALALEDADGEIRIERSIVGGVRARRRPDQRDSKARRPAPSDAYLYAAYSKSDRQTPTEGAFAPVTLQVTDSVLDSGMGDNTREEGGCHHADGENPVYNAVRGEGGRPAFVRACFVRSTIFGAVYVHEMPLAEDSIFIGCVSVARRRGCVRFCSLPDTSRTPPRYRCQPDVPLAALPTDKPTHAEKDAARRDAAPIFLSRRFGEPGYAYLARLCPDAVRAGASDEGEMGVFHDAQVYRKEKALTARLAESVPAGWESGVFYEFFTPSARKREE